MYTTGGFLEFRGQGRGGEGSLDWNSRHGGIYEWEVSSGDRQEVCCFTMLILLAANSGPDAFCNSHLVLDLPIICSENSYTCVLIKRKMVNVDLSHVVIQHGRSIKLQSSLCLAVTLYLAVTYQMPKVRSP